MVLEVIFAAGIAGFLMLYAVRIIDDPKHFALRMLLLGFFFIFVFLLGKAAFDAEDNCIQFIANATVSEGGNFTSYGYNEFCTVAVESTGYNLYYITNWLLGIFIAYAIIFIIWYFLSKAGKLPPKYLMRK